MSNFDDLVSALAAPADDQRSVSAVGRAVADSADGEVLVSFAARNDEDAEEYLTDADGDTIPEYDEDGYPVPQTVGGVPVYIVDDDDNPLPVIDPATGEQAVRYDEDGNAALVWQTANVPAVQQGAVPTVGRVASGDGVFMASDSGSITAVGAAGWGDTLQGIAEEAQETAEATNQHFWADDNGIHVTEAEHDATTEHNILINSIGILLRKATNYLVSITQSAIAFYDGLGNSASNIVAQFGSGGATIGKTGAAHQEMDYRTWRMKDKNQNVFAEVKDLRPQSGYAEITEWFSYNYVTDTNVFDLYLIPNQVTGVKFNGANVTGYTVSGSSVTVPSSALTGNGEVTITYTAGSDAAKSYTMGLRQEGAVEGPMSFAEGRYVTASGPVSHAEGGWTTATNRYSHAEGGYTKSTGRASHAEGWNTEARGEASHAGGSYTIAAVKNQTVIGRFNKIDDPTDGIDKAFIVGCGASESNREDALELGWDGNLWLKGKVASSSLPSASTSQAGIVQLSNSTSSTSTSLAATANSVRSVASDLSTESALRQQLGTDLSNLSSKVTLSGNFTNALIVFGYVTGGAQTVQLYGILPGFASSVTVTGTGAFTLRGGSGATLSVSVAAANITTGFVSGYKNLLDLRFTLSTAFAGGNNTSLAGFVNGLTLKFT